MQNQGSETWQALSGSYARGRGLLCGPMGDAVRERLTESGSRLALKARGGRTLSRALHGGSRLPMSTTHQDPTLQDGDTGTTNVITEVRRQEALLKTGALQNAILNSANFSIIATDEKGVIQLFNIGAERMLGYIAAEVVDAITPADISDPQEVIARAKALSVELATTISPGFEALVFKASRGIEDIYELTYSARMGA